jgi:FtsP/CotA-like multicopper oxidase with cupredoxin domain
MHKLTKRLLAVSCLLSLFAASVAGASTLVPQTALPGACIPQFAVPLPVFGPAGPIPRVNALQHPNITVTMKEVDQQVLPLGFTDTCGLGATFGPTRVWAYEIADTDSKQPLAPPHWPAVTVEATRGTPTTVTYVNQLPKFNQPILVNGIPEFGLVQGLITVDQTIHWVDPLNLGCMMQALDCTLKKNAKKPCCKPFASDPPAVAHLHGGEVPSVFDGGPEAWFTPTGISGAAYFTLDNPGPGKAIYRYPNGQEPGTPWFHDHALGATRTNVYSGLAAFYFLRDPNSEPKNLPSGPYEIEMAIQDRQFDTTGQLFFPDGSGDVSSNLNGPPPNPNLHPFWIPEFIGDVAVVNAAPWPFFNVEPRRYRFRIVDGSNARFYNLTFGAAPVYQIGADDNYLDRPVQVKTVFIAPGERADIIVDFSKLAGKTVTVTNSAAVPFPDGLFPVQHIDPATRQIMPADQPQMAQIMQFRVSATKVLDTSCNPMGDCKRPVPLVRLTDGQGKLANGVKIDKVRQLVLKEFEGPGGPVEVLVNNTRWDGTLSPNIANDFPVDGVSELPRMGSTELWEIINLTMDAHPMHTHLTQFQILNRQTYDSDGYIAAWNGAFGTGPVPLLPGCVSGQFCPEYGPPLPYNVPNADGTIGGNPAIGPFLLGKTTPPAGEESGWKDTAKAYPGQVLRILVRWTPTSTPVTPNVSLAGQNFYSFDPTEGPGYVWHCHIVDHEDNEMMRPYKVAK